MFPILLQIGPITLYSLWVLVAIGLLISLLVVNKLEKARFVNLEFLADNSLLIFFSGLICSRLIFILYNLSYFFSSTQKLIEIFYIWDKGLSIWGAVLGILVSLFFLARQAKENFWAWADILSVSMMACAVFLDLGAFLDGRNSGNPTDLPWGMISENSQYAVPIHPVQIYAAIYSLLITIVLYQCFNLKFFKQDGNISLMGVALFSLFRFIEEFMRGDETYLFFDTIREAHVYSFIILILSCYMLYRNYKQYQKNQS